MFVKIASFKLNNLDEMLILILVVYRKPLKSLYKKPNVVDKMADKNCTLKQFDSWIVLPAIKTVTCSSFHHYTSNS